MARNQTVISTTVNIFAFNRVRKECYYEPVRVDFCPISKPNHLFEPIIPCFNQDGHFFTPAFILPRQKVLTSSIKITAQENLIAQKNKFEARMFHSRSAAQEKTPEYKPTDDNYCQLCQQQFSDYWEHINGKYHKRMINTSKFNKDIIGLCESLQNTNKPSFPDKAKPIEKKKTPARRNTKSKNYKKDKNAQVSEEIKNKESLRTLESQGQIAGIEEELRSQEKREIEESLKITLQLANHSTNLLNSNTFKEQFCENS